MRRRLLLFTVIIILCTFICSIFILEFKFVESIKDQEQQVVLPSRNERHDDPVSREKYDSNVLSDIKTTPCSSRVDITTNMNDVYKLLKERKRLELRVENTVKEMWLYTNGRLKDAEIELRASTYLNASLKSMKAHYQSLRKHFSKLSATNSEFEPYQLNWKYWQRNISLELKSLIRKRIEHLQNPFDCKTAKKLVCRVAKSCGFGCQIHHTAFCFIMAYATKRTLILDSTNWRYSPRGWDAVFLPISTTCTELPTGIYPIIVDQGLLIFLYIEVGIYIGIYTGHNKFMLILRLNIVDSNG